MLYNVGCRMLLRNRKSYVVPCVKSYDITKMEIVCWTMWDVVYCYEIGNRMLYHVGSRMLLLNWKLYLVRCEMSFFVTNWKSYVVQCGKSYVVIKLEIVGCTM